MSNESSFLYQKSHYLSDNEQENSSTNYLKGQFRPLAAVLLHLNKIQKIMKEYNSYSLKGSF